MYLIYGIQKSGLSIVNYLENKKIKFKMWDDNPIVRKAIKKNYNKDYFFNIKKDNLNDFEKIFTFSIRGVAIFLKLKKPQIFEK